MNYIFGISASTITDKSQCPTPNVKHFWDPSMTNPQINKSAQINTHDIHVVRCSCFMCAHHSLKFADLYTGERASHKITYTHSRCRSLLGARCTHEAHLLEAGCSWYSKGRMVCLLEFWGGADGSLQKKKMLRLLLIDIPSTCFKAQKMVIFMQQRHLLWGWAERSHLLGKWQGWSNTSGNAWSEFKWQGNRGIQKKDQAWKGR